jgi:hypothetical protein|tara:strand:- start:3372 stop:3557 length:186 start_codon:yes stop_codon:yes gene_type:complete
MPKNVLARPGNFIKTKLAGDPCMGYVFMVDEAQGLMYVSFPKVHDCKWIVWDNCGQYFVIS